MNLLTWQWMRRVALQESHALRAYLRVKGHLPRCTTTRFDG